MKNSSDFDLAFEQLNKKLDALSGEAFFSMFGLNLDDLPSMPQYSPEFPLNSTSHSFPTYSDIDLKCA